MKCLIISLLAASLSATTAGAQMTDSLKYHCPDRFLTGEAQKDTIIILPEFYKLAKNQSVQLRGIQCGLGKARDITRSYGVKWSSSDTLVAKITRTTGRVYWRGPGNATISVVYP